MSLTKCPACGAAVSKSAASCPLCGHPLKAKSYGCGTLLAVAGAVLVVLVLLQNCGRQPVSSSAAPGIVPPSDEVVAAASEAARIEAERVRAERARSWTYSESADDMAAGTIRFAALQSVNSFVLGFPYEGEQRGTLTLRKHPRYGTSVLLMVSRGQILCGISDCSFQVRFDDGQSRAWAMSEPESRDSTILFVNNWSRFVEQMRSSKRVRVEVIFYQQPPVTLEFDVSEFDYDRWQGKVGTSGSGVVEPTDQAPSPQQPEGRS